MKKEGFVFLDIIIALFIIGLMVVVFFPTFSLIDKSFEKSKDITEMTYFSESIMEELRSRKELSLEFLEKLETEIELEYPHIKNDKYVSKVVLLDSPTNLWNIDIFVSRKDGKGGKEYVEIKATIPKS